MATRLWRLLPALLLLCPPPAVARADDAIPDAATIRQHIREAAGPEPTVLRQTTVTTWSDGSAITRTHVQRGEDYRDAVDEGPFHTEHGSVNGEASADRFILDTGGVGTFFIRDYFARRHPEALHDEGGGKTARLDYRNSRVYLTPNAEGRNGMGIK